jgi:hypothetical protein
MKCPLFISLMARVFNEGFTKKGVFRLKNAIFNRVVFPLGFCYIAGLLNLEIWTALHQAYY